MLRVYEGSDQELTRMFETAKSNEQRYSKLAQWINGRNSWLKVMVKGLTEM